MRHIIGFIIYLFVGGRWYIQLIPAVLLIVLAAFGFQSGLKLNEQRAQALKDGPPSAVSLNSFDPAKDVHAANEVNLTGWIDPSYNSSLTKRVNFFPTATGRMFVVFGPDDPVSANEVRAAIIMPESAVEQFVDDLLLGAADGKFFGSVGGNPVVAFGGITSDSNPLSEVANKALREQGLTKAKNFQYLTVWPAGGREAALQPVFPLYQTSCATPLGLALVLLVIAAVKYRNGADVDFDINKQPNASSRPAGSEAAVGHVSPATEDTFSVRAATLAETAPAKPLPAAPVRPEPKPRPGTVEDAFAAFATERATAFASRPATWVTPMNSDRSLRSQSVEAAPAPVPKGSIEDVFAAFASQPSAKRP